MMPNAVKVNLTMPHQQQVARNPLSRPSSSHQVPSYSSSPQHGHETFGQPYAATHLNAQTLQPSSNRHPTKDSASAAEDTRYVVYLRLPFPRNGFVDPLPVDWDASKERSLWKTMSKAKNTGDIPWNVLADGYGVTVPFLLQQAAWLYERQLSQVKAQLRRVGGTAVAQTASGTGSPAPGSPRPTEFRTPSSASVRPASATMQSRPVSMTFQASQAAQFARGPPSGPFDSTPMSRTTSNATARPAPTQASLLIPSDISSNPTIMARGPSSRYPDPANTSPTTIRRSSSSSSMSSTASSNNSSSIQARSRLIRKRRTVRESFHHNGDITDEDESPAFLPWADGESNNAEGNSTITSSAPRRTRRSGHGSTTGTTDRHDTAPRRYHTPSMTSVQQVLSLSQGSTSSPESISRTSPRRTTGTANGDKNGNGKGSGGNESSPSMGSSFSDLSDASVSQSALEEQYNALGNGTLGSRMSTISQAVRSRYF